MQYYLREHICTHRNICTEPPGEEVMKETEKEGLVARPLCWACRRDTSSVCVGLCEDTGINESRVGRWDTEAFLPLLQNRKSNRSPEFLGGLNAARGEYGKDHGRGMDTGFPMEGRGWQRWETSPSREL